MTVTVDKQQEGNAPVRGVTSVLHEARCQASYVRKQTSSKSRAGDCVAAS